MFIFRYQALGFFLARKYLGLVLGNHCRPGLPIRELHGKNPVMHIPNSLLIRNMENALNRLFRRREEVFENIFGKNTRK